MQWTAQLDSIGTGRGFTLLELLITLAVVTIVLAIGVPAFNRLTTGNQQTAEINRLIRSLQLGRSNAILSGFNHILCPSSNGIDCLAGIDWGQGYILFEDRNENEARDPEEKLLHVSRPSGKIGIDMHSTIGRQWVVYRSDGRSAGSNLTLTFCDPEDRIPPKAVILSNMGRARVSSTRWDGSPLNCDPESMSRNY
jgi:type IV fimbrial biogenesis protein FimT